MKNITKHPSTILQKQMSDPVISTSRTPASRYIKFERIKKQCSTLPLKSIDTNKNSNINNLYSNFIGKVVSNSKRNQSYQPVYRKQNFIYDQQTMNQMITSLKQQNNSLKTLTKIQQTQICYFQEKQKSYILATCGNQNDAANLLNQKGLLQNKAPNKVNNMCYIKKLQLHNFRLKKQVKRLQEQVTKLKRTFKYTNIKQLEVQKAVCEEQLKNLTAKLLIYEKSAIQDPNSENKKKINSNTVNIKQINKIIEKEYYESLKNKQLQRNINQKSIQLQHTLKLVRKLKNIISQKNHQIQVFKQQREKTQAIINKSKNLDQYVPKSELITKKKQLLAMSQTIQKLEQKLIQCEAKAQSLQQQNIDNMNRQANKRKEILKQFQKLKKNYQNMQQTLALSMKKNNDSPHLLPQMRLDKVPSLDTQFPKPRIPLVVTLQHIKQAVDKIIYNLQSSSIDHQQAILLIAPYQMKQYINAKKTSEKGKYPGRSNTSPILNESAQEQISIRQIIHCLQKTPIGLQKYEQKQMIARYLVQSESDDNFYINFDSPVSISYVRSVFKRILHQYPIFTSDEISTHSSIVYDFLSRFEHNIRATLSKIPLDNSYKQPVTQSIAQLSNNGPNSSNMGNSHNNSSQNSRYIRGHYKCKDYIQAILKQRQSEMQLTQLTIQFVKYWSYQLKQGNKHVTFDEFMHLFKMEGVCTFITSDPNQDHMAYQNHITKTEESSNDHKAKTAQMHSAGKQETRKQQQNCRQSHNQQNEEHYSQNKKQKVNENKEAENSTPAGQDRLSQMSAQEIEQSEAEKPETQHT